VPKVRTHITSGISLLKLVDYTAGFLPFGALVKETWRRRCPNSVPGQPILYLW